MFYQHNKLNILSTNRVVGAMNMGKNWTITRSSVTAKNCWSDHFCNKQWAIYTSDSSVDTSTLEDFFKTKRVPSIDPEAVTELEDLSVTEIASAISSMQSGKSPGPNGYPTGFKKKKQKPKHSDQLSPLLWAVSEELFSLKTLPLTMPEAVISLLLKKDKNILEFSSFRPISLLNTDINILAKVLACRLEGVLPSIISPNQTGFIKNRQSFFFF